MGLRGGPDIRAALRRGQGTDSSPTSLSLAGSQHRRPGPPPASDKVKQGKNRLQWWRAGLRLAERQVNSVGGWTAGAV